MWRHAVALHPRPPGPLVPVPCLPLRLAIASHAGLGEGGEVGLTEQGGAQPTAARRAPHPQVHFAGSTSPAPGEWSEERGQQALRTQCPPGLCGGSVHGPPGAVGLAEVSLRTGGSPKPLGGHSLSRSS